MPNTHLDDLKATQAQERQALTRILDAARTDGIDPAQQRSAEAMADRIAARQDEIDQATEAAHRAEVSAAAHRGSTHTETIHGPAYTNSRDVYAEERDKRGERSFFADMYNAQRGDVMAQQRQSQFQADNQYRAASTGSFAGLVVPQYLVDQAALIARTARPVTESMTRLNIPDQGMTFYVPKGTTGASVATQATENTTVSNTDEVWANVQVNVQTLAGQQDVSRQALERGTPGIDRLVFIDLTRAYFAAQETQVITGTGTGTKGIQNVGGNQSTAYAAALTPALFTKKVAGAVNSIIGSRFVSPTHVAMHPRRWAWLLSQSDGNGRPLVVPGVYAMNTQVTGDAASAYGDTGYQFLGLRVVVSAGIPTNVGTNTEDLVFVYNAHDHLLWESADGTPNQLRFEQTSAASLTVKLVAYGFWGFTAERYPTSISIVGGVDSTAGNGQINPAF